MEIRSHKTWIFFDHVIKSKAGFNFYYLNGFILWFNSMTNSVSPIRPWLDKWLQTSALLMAKKNGWQLTMMTKIPGLLKITPWRIWNKEWFRFMDIIFAHVIKNNVLEQQMWYYYERYYHYNLLFYSFESLIQTA